MKKYLACFLILAVSLFTLCSCASSDDAAANSPPEPSTSVEDSAESNKPAEETRPQPDGDEPATETPSQS